MRKLYIASILGLGLGLGVGTALWAHDARLHQPNATVGDIANVGADSFELTTAKGSFKVTYSSKTKFEHGGAAVDKSHLVKGDHVGVIGTKLPSGEIVAREVLLGVERESPETKGKTQGSDHKH
jgi:hypothetical protein